MTATTEELTLLLTLKITQACVVGINNREDLNSDSPPSFYRGVYSVQVVAEAPFLGPLSPPGAGPC